MKIIKYLAKIILYTPGGYASHLENISLLDLWDPFLLQAFVSLGKRILSLDSGEQLHTHTNELLSGLSVEGKAQIRSEIQGVIYFILGEKGISSLANSWKLYNSAKCWRNKDRLCTNEELK